MTPGAINFHVFLCHDSDTHISPRSETTWQMKRNSCLSNPLGLKEISLRWNSRYGNVSLLIFLFSRNKFLLVMSQRHSKQLLDDTPRSCRIMRENDYNLSDGEEWEECEERMRKFARCASEKSWSGIFTRWFENSSTGNEFEDISISRRVWMASAARNRFYLL